MPFRYSYRGNSFPLSTCPDINTFLPKPRVQQTPHLELRIRDFILLYSFLLSTILQSLKFLWISSIFAIFGEMEVFLCSAIFDKFAVCSLDFFCDIIAIYENFRFFSQICANFSVFWNFWPKLIPDLRYIRSAWLLSAIDIKSFLNEF